MNISKFTATALAAGTAMFSVGAIAHDGGDNDAGTPVCVEANYMVADAQFAPASNNPGPGRVIEQNIITGERGITVNNPFGGGNAGTPVCPAGVVCPGPWKPTGTFSGGQKGHAYITSAAQHALTELHRDGTPIRTVSYNDVLEVTPGDGDGFGHVPRPLGTQIMPNGNLVQAICDANFNQIPPAGGGASNSDENPGFWPPVWTSDARRANSRILVIDQDTLEVIDEYSQPKKGRLGHDLWGCAAGIMFDENSMYISLFHGGAVLAIDWRAGVDRHSRGVGSNKPFHHGKSFKIGKKRNRAKVTDVIDFVGGAATNGHRRDSMRAISFDEQGNIYGTNRRRALPCDVGELGPQGCNPGTWRQRVSIDLVSVSGGATDEDATLALDPGVNVIAGIRINRMSAKACEAVLMGGAATDEDCNTETLYVAASAMNPGCTATTGPGVNPCFVWGGYVAEYLIDEAHLDGGSAWGGVPCDADPTSLTRGMGCAQPIATFGGIINGNENLDPRMLMPIQRAFIQ